MELSKDFLDLLELLGQHRVEYLVVGGYSNRQENAVRMMQALSDFGFGETGLRAEDFQESDTIVQLGREPNRIDILTELKGLDFSSCFERRRTLRLDSGVRVNLIARDDLLANKRAVGRPQDLADVVTIQATPAPGFDD